MRYTFQFFKLRFDYHEGVLMVFKQVPNSDRHSWISEHLETLNKDPEDVLTRFTLANNLRMDGQVQQSRVEYGKIVKVNHPQWSFLAKKVLEEFEGVSDHSPSVVWSQYRSFYLKFWSSKRS